MTINKSPILQSYTDFSTEMPRVFDHPLRGKDASGPLFSLGQGPNPVSHYAIDFRILAAESGWNEVALCGAFYCGLNDDLKDKLAARDDTDSLEELMGLAICLDNVEGETSGKVS